MNDKLLRFALRFASSRLLRSCCLPASSALDSARTVLRVLVSQALLAHLGGAR
jgi:hypothetical protein